MTSRILVCLLFLIAGTSTLYSQAEPCDAFYRGVNHRFANEWDKAIAELTKAIDLKCPDLGEAYWIRGEARYGKKEYDGAIADATKAISTLDEPAAAYRLRGFAKYEKSEFKDAIADLTKAIELQPNSETAYEYRGRARENSGDLDGAIADYDQLIALLGNEAADGYLLRATVYNKKGDKVRAFADFDRVIKMAPNHPLPYYSRGYAHYSNKNYGPAIADLKNALAFDPTYVEAHHYIGHSYHEQQLYPEAIAAFSAAIKLDPNFAGYYIDRALVYRDQLDLSRAEADFVKANQLEPANPDFHLSLAWINLLNSNYAKASANAGAILAKHGMKDNAAYAVAVGYLALKLEQKQAEATAFLKKWKTASSPGTWHNSLFRFLNGEITPAQFLAAAVDDDKLFEARSFIGAMAILDGNPAIAKAQMDRIKASGEKRSFPYSFLSVLSKKGPPPAPVSAHYTQGLELYHERKNAEAIAAFTKAITADPKRPEYFAARAKVNIALRKIPAAMLDLDRSIAIGGTHEAYSLRANIHIEQGMYDKAVADLEKGSSFLKASEGDNTLPNHEATLAGVHALLGKASAYKPSQDAETVTYYFYNWLYEDALNDKSAAHYGLALAKFTAAAARFPDKTEFLAERGQVWIELGKPDKALADFDNVLVIDRKKRYVQLYRSEAFLKMKRYAEAIATVDAALAARALDEYLQPRAYEIRAAANCALGNKAEAGIDEAEAKILGGEIKTPCR